jgi:hypothetical protein
VHPVRSGGWAIDQNGLARADDARLADFVANGAQGAPRYGVQVELLFVGRNRVPLNGITVASSLPPAGNAAQSVITLRRRSSMVVRRRFS